MEEVVHMFCVTLEENSRINRWKLQESTLQINSTNKQIFVNEDCPKIQCIYSESRDFFLEMFKLPEPLVGMLQKRCLHVWETGQLSSSDPKFHLFSMM